MKKIISISFLLVVGLTIMAQATVKDSTITGKMTVVKDPRLDMLAKKQIESNDRPFFGVRAAKGYRLLVLSSNDREQAMKVRAQLLQRFPEQKVYMLFQAPYIKLKFGNFLEKADAEKYRDLLARQRVVTNNIYIVPETVEIKYGSNKEKDDE